MNSPTPTPAKLDRPLFVVIITLFLFSILLCAIVICSGCQSPAEIKQARFEQSVKVAQADPATQAQIAQGIAAGKAALASQRQ